MSTSLGRSPVSNRDQARLGHNIFLDNCDSTPGTSGSPIFAVVDGQIRVIGINVGMRVCRKNFCTHTDGLGIANMIPYDTLHFDRLN